MNAWIHYSLARLALFVGVLAVLLLLGVDWLIAAIIAALVGLCLSYILFNRQRDAVARAIAARAGRSRTDSNADAEEDEALDRSE